MLIQLLEDVKEHAAVRLPDREVALASVGGPSGSCQRLQICDVGRELPASLAQNIGFLATLAATLAE